MKYQALLSLHLFHPYYNDGRCLDFQITPSSDTERSLKNNRSLMKIAPDGMRILTAVSDNNFPIIPFQQALKFTFHLFLQNPDFTLFTDLSQITQFAAPLYQNPLPGQGGAMRLGSRETWYSERFSVRHPAAQDRFILCGQPIDLVKPTDFVFEGLEVQSHQLAYNLDAKMLTIDTSEAQTGDPFTVHYPILPSLDRDVFADVEINMGSSSGPLPQVPPDFQISFAAKKARWKYYVIAESSLNLLRIEDKNTTPLSFSIGSDLNKAPDPDDKLGRLLQEQYPDRQCLRFVSDALIPCQQQSRKSIQLLSGSNALVAALPNPPLKNYSEDSLYQVIKYISP